MAASIQWPTLNYTKYAGLCPYPKRNAPELKTFSTFVHAGSKNKARHRSQKTENSRGAAVHDQERVSPMRNPQYGTLFVDDQPATIEPLMDYTQSQGFEAICGPDPTAGMSLIQSEYINIIVVVPEFEMGDINVRQFRAMMRLR
jgi:hypothetical protein